MGRKADGVALATLMRHYERWMPDPARNEVHRLERDFGGSDQVQDPDVDPTMGDVDPSVKFR
jgi:hypothetical protein